MDIDYYYCAEEANTITFTQVNHQINWQKGSDRMMKLPDVMKLPINASFQIKKKRNWLQSNGTGYLVLHRPTREITEKY